MSKFDSLQDHEFRRDEWDARERKGSAEKPMKPELEVTPICKTCGTVFPSVNQMLSEVASRAESETPSREQGEKPKFTPGPWRVVLELGLPTVVAAESEKVADIICTRVKREAKREELAANARLIAAAPTLYAACQAMRKSLNGSPTDFAGMLAAHRQLDAAVALVDGPQQETK